MHDTRASLPSAFGAPCSIHKQQQMHFTSAIECRNQSSLSPVGTIVRRIRKICKVVSSIPSTAPSSRDAQGVQKRPPSRFILRSGLHTGRGLSLTYGGQCFASRGGWIESILWVSSFSCLTLLRAHRVVYAFSAPNSGLPQGVTSRTSRS